MELGGCRNIGLFSEPTPEALPSLRDFAPFHPTCQFGNRHFPHFPISAFLTLPPPPFLAEIAKLFYSFALNPAFWSSWVVLSLA